MRKSNVLLRAAVALTMAIAAPSMAMAANATQAAEYVEVGSYLTDDAEINAWYEMQYHLRENFDDICGDTFCEGDYSNIYALRFRCSVEQFSGVLGRCVWVFAASNEEVDPATGKIQVTPKIWRCRSPLAPGTTVSALLGALAGERPLYAKLPGTSVSIYDGLIDCL
ncbi:hypothetical protein IEQ11_07015 [Lysobacter capsici]|uniref:hypothetical protein n=1 Tax=Lysobacter capsici TaxID=435897 RepID=UPI001783B1B1|nr:hypothetical protein [Lysobacter capsici]UOF16394.1 hypothetical protein IEQ11_07015 [Lysobacter capsici]